MADQARWFKLWCSAPGDDTLQNLPPTLRWAWVALGAYTKQHGTSGVVTISPTNALLAAQLGVTPADLIPTLGCLPSIYLGTAPVRWPHGHEKSAVCAGEFMRGTYPPSVRGTSTLEEWCTRHGKLTVTWKNWTKYQEDTTQAARGAASRIKRRREEIRRDEMRREEKKTRTTTTPSSVSDVATWASADWPSPEALAHLYNTATPDNVPAVKSLSSKRRDKAKKMLRQFPDRAWWEDAFKHYHRSRFLSGRSTPSNGHEGFQPDFDWLLSNGKNGTENAVKVHDGNYQ